MAKIVDLRQALEATLEEIKPKAALSPVPSCEEVDEEEEVSVKQELVLFIRDKLIILAFEIIRRELDRAIRERKYRKGMW